MRGFHHSSVHVGFIADKVVLKDDFLRILQFSHVYRVSQEERTKLRESVPYVKLYRYNPKHLYTKLNGYGDNGQRKVWTSCISASCTSTVVSRIDRDRGMRYAFL